MGAQIYYAEGADTLAANLVEARPTILTCVPRLYEVLRQRIVDGRRSGRAASASGCSTWRWSSAGGATATAACRRIWPLSDLLLDRLVRAQGARALRRPAQGDGLGRRAAQPRCRACSSMRSGLPVLQGYGQTEASPVISANLPGRAKLDTVGPPLDGVEIRIADDGEILVRGDLVMRGYWKDEEATAQALRDGWLHTGDIGELDADGYLKITDRKKDMIVNSGGDNVAPARVEGVLLLRAARSARR